jgi:hypothetical protein
MCNVFPNRFETTPEMRRSIVAAQHERLETQPHQITAPIRSSGTIQLRISFVDGVGLGKTVQAGLMVMELTARRLAQDVLNVSLPALTLMQQRSEVCGRFGVGAKTSSCRAFNEAAREAPIRATLSDDASPGQVSVAFVKQEQALLERYPVAFGSHAISLSSQANPNLRGYILMINVIFAVIVLRCALLGWFDKAACKKPTVIERIPPSSLPASALAWINERLWYFKGPGQQSAQRG